MVQQKKGRWKLATWFYQTTGMIYYPQYDQPHWKERMKNKPQTLANHTSTLWPILVPTHFTEHAFESKGLEWSGDAIWCWSQKYKRTWCEDTRALCLCNSLSPGRKCFLLIMETQTEVSQGPLLIITYIQFLSLAALGPVRECCQNRLSFRKKEANHESKVFCIKSLFETLFADVKTS